LSRIRTLATALLWLWAVGALAYPGVRFERISMAEGLSQSGISAMAQDDAGYLWFGTQYGLNRYDGYQFQVWRHDPDDLDSLASSRVTDILASRSGELWVGSKKGLNRFDPRHGRIKRIELPHKDAPAHPGETGVSILAGEDGHGNLLITLHSGAPAVWRAATGRVERLVFEPDLPVEEQRTASALVDDQGRFWIHNRHGLWRGSAASPQLQRVWQDELVVHERDPANALALTTAGGILALARNSGLWLFEAGSAELLRHVDPRRHGTGSSVVDAVTASSDGALWIATRNTLVRYWPDSDHWQRMAELDDPPAVSQRRLQIAEANGEVWLAGEFGVARYRPGFSHLQRFEHRPDDPGSLPGSPRTNPYSVFASDDGTIWIGSWLGGLARYSPQRQRFEHVNSAGLSPDMPLAGRNVVRAVLETRPGDRELLWIGLESAGLRVLERVGNGRYGWRFSLHADASDPRHRLPDDRVHGLATAHGGRVVLLSSGRSLLAVDGSEGRILWQRPVASPDRPARSQSLLVSRPQDRVLVGTSRGIRVFDLPNPRQPPRLLTDPALLEDCEAFNLLELEDGRVLVACRARLALLDPATLEVVWQASHEALGQPAGTAFYGLAQSPAGTLWVGADEGGLLRLNLPGPSARPDVSSLRRYNEAHGLVDRTIYAILPQADGALWLSSNRGLMRFDPDLPGVRHFTPRDGLQEYEFNNTVAAIGPSGRYYFGGINGVNGFFPDRIEAHPKPPLVHLQGLSINEQRLDPATHEGVVQLDLAHDNNTVEFQYVGLHYADPQRNRYRYRLEGADRGWVEAAYSRQVRYPDLKSGQYRFFVQAANSDGVWSTPHLLAGLTIRPPPWQSGWAYLGYTLASLLLLGLFAWLQLRKRVELANLVQQRTSELAEQRDLVARQADELREALAQRTAMFANVSHEFRTPLTLIQASLERLHRQGADPSAISLGRRYLRKLLLLVDQLLDLARLRSEQPRSETGPWSPGALVSMIVSAFEPLAERRGIGLTVELESGWQTRCAQELVEKILQNLISNAIKFTPSGGRVIVRLHAHGSGLRLTVADSGPGISQRDQERIFERFHRVPATEQRHVAGAGIGLALVREAVNALGGRVSVDSRPGQGACFHVDLAGERVGAAVPPPRRLVLQADALDLPPPDCAITPEQPGVNSGQRRVLIAEDNPDLRDYLRELLSPQWRVIEAADGREALDLAQRHAPEVIVSDILMPHMDGLELLTRLRESVETRHIPVLLLTARRDTSTRLKGLSLSADDFLAKPFEPAELTLRLERMIANRERLRQRLRRELAEQTRALDRGSIAGETDLDQRDRALFERLHDWAAAHFADPDAGAREMAVAVSLEPRTLQRKVKSLTGLTPAQFLRAYRLRCASEALLASRQSVSEIAFDCGFSSPQYFTRVFRREYGLPPDQWRQHGRRRESGS